MLNFFQFPEAVGSAYNPIRLLLCIYHLLSYIYFLLTSSPQRLPMMINKFILPVTLRYGVLVRYLTNGEKPSMGLPMLREKNPMSTPKYETT